MKFERIGKHLRLVDVRNRDLTVTNLLGINIEKRFLPSVADVSETDLSRYKVIKKNQFAFSPMQVGRDETIRVALFPYDTPAIITSAYLVFEIIDTSILLPEFLMMYFKRPETNRYGWFISDGSVRSSLEWERFCDIEIPIPAPEIQKKNVALYSGMLEKQGTYERSIADLEMICDSYLENLKKKHPSIKISPYLREVDDRNVEFGADRVKGVSTSKVLIETAANLEGVGFSGYKLVQTGQFVFVPDTSRRGEKIALAMNTDKACLVSSIYTVFEITDQSKILPEFLFLWLKRSEFDRYARFHSIGSAREVFDWEDMCEVKIPIPDLEAQRAIIAVHHALEKRKTIAQKLNEVLAPLCPVLIQGVTA